MKTADLFNEFCEVLEVRWQLPTDLKAEADRLVLACSGSSCLGRDDRIHALLAVINEKFELHKDRVQSVLDRLAGYRVFPNYHEKASVRRAFDANDPESFYKLLRDLGIPSDLNELFRPNSREQTIAQLKQQLNNPVIRRKDARQTPHAERREAILRSLFGGFAFSVFPQRDVHSHLNPDCKTNYCDEYFDHLLTHHHQVLNRDCALVFLVVDENIAQGVAKEDFRNRLCGFVSDSYRRLSNHCFLAVLLKTSIARHGHSLWELYSDLILFAEKHRESELKTAYFRPEVIQRATAQYIPSLDVKRARFNIANEGFAFRDCFVLLQDVGKTVDTTGKSCDLLLLFEKNERNESIVPCPACRSHSVASNSYPVLGVRSWECQNLICPARSPFDRGNRFSVASLLKQRAIASSVDQIPEAVLRRWKLDVVAGTSDDEVAEMLLRHFSLHGDTVVFVNAMGCCRVQYGRTVVHEALQSIDCAESLWDQFRQSTFFERFLVRRGEPDPSRVVEIDTHVPNSTLYCGDCYDAMERLDDNSIDGSVTSPPYYNAREYTQWPNIYCYLYDMFNSARQVFRVLKPGALYLYNVFDYFDNENTLALSAMGRKRMVLGAYAIRSFLEVGFELESNVVWFKGEIEGKRNYNQGNRSPYYQFPLNCWEHILVFRKPGTSEHRDLDLPSVLCARPVLKMVNGENRYGHTAPFPQEIPQLLLDTLPVPDSRVLDPYGGSLTTARTALAKQMRSVSVELHMHYCQLGVDMLRRSTPGLFVQSD